MKYQIFIHSEPDYDWIAKDSKKVAETVLSYLNAPDGDLTLVFTDNESIRKLNMEYAGVNHPTDVLAFSNGDTDMETGKMYYGDVILSMPIAEQQAREAGHPLRDELTLLIVHGVLHLLGFDHSGEDDRHKMWSIQDEILSQLGCKIASPGSR